MSIKSHRRHRHGRHLKRRAPPGASPGTISVDPDAPGPVIRVIGYGPDSFSEETLDCPEALRERAGRWPVLWVNVDGLGDADVINQIGETFGLHPLALEDVVNVGQRAKLEEYENHLFLVTHMVTLNEQLETEQISVFLGKDFVITFQEKAGDCFDPVRERIRAARGHIRKAGADYLLYALVDAVIDHYFPVLEQYDERLEKLETEVLAQPGRETIWRIHNLKREFQSLRRAMWPQRTAVGALLQESSAFIAHETRPYLRDCHDHVLRIIDWIEVFSEHASDLISIYLSSVSNRMNEIMKVLTVTATIFIPLTFMAGVYGMNFSPAASPWNMPELNWHWGYPAILLAMAGVAAGLLLYFRRKGFF